MIIVCVNLDFMEWLINICNWYALRERCAHAYTHTQRHSFKFSYVCMLKKRTDGHENAYHNVYIKISLMFGACTE